jgi:hypothetical protein
MPLSDILELLDDMRSFLDHQSDAEIIDGKMIPNRAMRLMGSVEEAYEKLERAGCL